MRRRAVLARPSVKLAPPERGPLDDVVLHPLKADILAPIAKSP